MTGRSGGPGSAPMQRPDDPDVLIDRVRALRATGDLAGAFRALSRLRQVAPHAPAAYLEAAPLLVAAMVDPAGYFTVGERFAKRAVVLAPGDVTAWHTLIDTYRRYDATFLRRCISALGCLAPLDSERILLAARRLAELGDDRTSRRVVTRALLIDPTSLQAVLDLSGAADSRRRRLLETALRHTVRAETRALGPAVAARLVLAGFAHADGRHAEAYGLASQSNALRLRVVGANAGSFVDRARKVVAAGTAIEAAVPPVPRGLILLGGLPRSGTTLAERRIARATGAFALGETGLLELAFNRIAGRQFSSTAFADRLERALASVTETPWVIEKMPMALVYRGLAERLFARTRVVLTVRPFLANFLSGHFIDYADRLPFFAEIGVFAQVYRYYLELIREAAEARPPSEVAILPLERLAADPDAVTDRLVQRLGLDRRAADPDAQAIVRTASLRSVRETVARGRPDQYAPYDGLLDPTARALVAAVEADRERLLVTCRAHVL